MKKLFWGLVLTTIIIFSTTGCVKRDSMEDIDIITSSYPIEYLINKIYGDHATIENIFPDSETIDDYKFNDKQLNNFSKKVLFVYNGRNSSDIAMELTNRNNKLLLIDSTLGMTYNYGVEETWLDPSNLLMMAQNIKNGLEEYISSAILISEINKAYDDLKVTLSELDAEIKLTVQNANDNVVVVTNPALKYLEKYGLKVFVLDNNAIDKTLQDVIDLAKDEKIKYVYVFENDKLNDKIEKTISSAKLTKLTFYRLDSINDEQRKGNKDYLQIMHDNLDLLKQEIYK